MMKSSNSLGKIALTWAAAGFAMTAIVASGMRADAQAIASHNTQAPVSFDSGGFTLDHLLPGPVYAVHVQEQLFTRLPGLLLGTGKRACNQFHTTVQFKSNHPTKQSHLRFGNIMLELELREFFARLDTAGNSVRGATAVTSAPSRPKASL